MKIVTGALIGLAFLQMTSEARAMPIGVLESLRHPLLTSRADVAITAIAGR